jgi:hypothetical protein
MPGPPRSPSAAIPESLGRADWLRELHGLLFVGVHADPNTNVYLTIEHPTGAQLALATVATLPTYTLTTAMLVMLWRLVGAARRTDPFTWATVRRLRALGWLLIIGGPVAWLVELGARFSLSGTVSSRGPQAILDLFGPGVWFLVGLGMPAIGEVVRSGQALRTELDGVV